MKRTCKLSLSFLCFLICFLLSMSGIRARDEALAADIAPKILRFHVLANSDSAKDQALKLRVKDLLLEKIRDGAAAGQIAGKEELKAYILSESSTLEAAAEDFIHSFGYDYGVHVGIETCRFPVRTYGDMTFPAGMYEAVRVTIGNRCRAQLLVRSVPILMLHGQRSCVDAGGIEGNVEKSDPRRRFSVAAKGKTGLFPEKHQPSGHWRRHFPYSYRLCIHP